MAFVECRTLSSVHSFALGEHAENADSSGGTDGLLVGAARSPNIVQHIGDNFLLPLSLCLIPTFPNHMVPMDDASATT